MPEVEEGETELVIDEPKAESDGFEYPEESPLGKFERNLMDCETEEQANGAFSLFTQIESESETEHAKARELVTQFIKRLKPEQKTLV